MPLFLNCRQLPFTMFSYVRCVQIGVGEGKGTVEEKETHRDRDKENKLSSASFYKGTNLIIWTPFLRTSSNILPKGPISEYNHTGH